MSKDWKHVVVCPLRGNKAEILEKHAGNGARSLETLRFRLVYRGLPLYGHTTDRFWSLKTRQTRSGNTSFLELRNIPKTTKTLENSTRICTPFNQLRTAETGALSVVIPTPETGALSVVRRLAGEQGPLRD